MTPPWSGGVSLAALSFPPATQRSLLIVFFCYHLAIVVDILKAMGDREALEDPVPLALHTVMLGCLLILLGLGHKSGGGAGRQRKQKS